MRFQRSSGVLLHPTSLPGPFGIGDLGKEAYTWVDWLVESQQKLWQIFPLGPTGYGDSPYQCFSALAGNPLLINPEKLVEQGLLSASDLAVETPFPDQCVNFGDVIPFKHALLHKAYETFTRQATAEQRAAFAAFCQQHQAWLEDYTLFMALKDAHQGAAWSTWERELVTRAPTKMAQWKERLTAKIEYYKFLQYLFFEQWLALKAYAAQKQIKIIGDIPIFVAFDSADAWAHKELFYFDDAGHPLFVAGVPPDYFSPTGQLWGNPLYRWDRMKAHGYEWWIQRFRSAFELVDIVRLDHFRGFAQYWRVRFGEETAVQGSWEDGPGEDFFTAVEQALGTLPIIAEDLGVITPDVTALREKFAFPGMKILQFAFDSGEANDYLPHKYEQNCVVYTGTHDNDTTLGWYQKASQHDRKWVKSYLKTEGRDIVWDFIRAAWTSNADIAMVPLQDVLGLGSEARMNTPGTTGGQNWRWRFTWDLLKAKHRDRLKRLTQECGR